MKSVPCGKAIWNANGEFVSVLLTHLFLVFYLFFFVQSTISRQPAGRFTPKFACGRTLVPDVSYPFLWISSPPPGGGGKKGNKIFVTLRVNGGIFAFWWFLSDISATRGRIHTEFYLCGDNVCRRAPSPSGVHRPLGGRGEGS